MLQVEERLAGSVPQLHHAHLHDVHLVGGEQVRQDPAVLTSDSRLEQRARRKLAFPGLPSWPPQLPVLRSYGCQPSPGSTFPFPFENKNPCDGLTASPQSPYVVDLLALKSDGIRWGLWEDLGPEGGALMNGIGARIRDQAELLGHFRHMRTQQGGTRRGTSPEHDHAGALILDFSAS